jgi:cullin 3
MQGTSGPNFDQEWSGLAASFQHIHEKQASALSYEELYRKAYQLVLRKQGELLYDNVIDFEKTWLTGRIQTAVLSLLSSELTTPPALGGSSFGASVAERCFAGERLLKGVWSEWNDHNICLNMISDVTMYLVCSLCAAQSYLC